MHAIYCPQCQLDGYERVIADRTLRPGDVERVRCARCKTFVVVVVVAPVDA